MENYWGRCALNRIHLVLAIVPAVETYILSNMKQQLDDFVSASKTIGSQEYLIRQIL